MVIIFKTGVFWKALPDRGFGEKSKKMQRRQKENNCASAAGTKEKAVVVWNAETPWCLKQFDKSVLPVDYRSQKSSWMTSKILESVLTTPPFSEFTFHYFILDNAGCHPESEKCLAI